MKKALSLLLTAVLVLFCFAFSGCGGSEDSGGELVFLSKTEAMRKKEYKSFTIEEGTCLCVIPDDISGEVTIPAQANGKAVSVVTGGNSEGLTKLTVECDKVVFDQCCNSCHALESVTFKKDVSSFFLSFQYCSALTSVTFEGKVGLIDSHSFSDCYAMGEIVVPDGTTIRERSSYAGIPIVTQSAHQYFDSLPMDEIAARAEQALGTYFDKSKMIKAKDAPQFADQLNAPIFYSDICADCNESEYSAEKVPKNAEIRYYSFGDTNDSQHKVFTEEKRRGIESGSDHIVYCLAEPIKGNGVSYIPQDSDDKKSQKFYYMNYRISFWDYNDNALIGWLTVSTGYAPETIDSSAYYTAACGDSTDYFLCSFNKTRSTALSAVKGVIY